MALRRRPQAGPRTPALVASLKVIRFIEGEEAHRRMDRLAQKYLGSDRFEWLMPGEQRVSVIVRPTNVRHIVGVERFRPGGPAPTH